MISEKLFIKLVLVWIGLAFIIRVGIFPFERFGMFAGDSRRTYEYVFINDRKGTEFFSNTLLSTLEQKGASCGDYNTFILRFAPHFSDSTYIIYKVKSKSGNKDTVLVCSCSYK